MEFYSPGWPNPYPNHTDCVKVLEAPRSHLIKLDFREFFDLEPSPDCKFDFLEVRDGAHGYGKLQGQYCGKDFPPMILSTDRYLWLHFRSDENIEYGGFKAVYEYVERPATPRSHLIKLDFREFFDLEPSPDCKFDFLEVRDGAHGYGKLQGQYCGKDFPPTILSTDRYLWLHFRSDENIEYGGFKAVYEYVERPATPRSHLIKLDFREFFDLEPSPDCKFDFLEVRDGAHGYGKLQGQYCGKDFPPMILSTDRYLWLHFRSDENIEYGGFKAVYEYVERPATSFTPEVETCRIYLNGSEAQFSSTDIPQERRKLVDEYNMPLDCMWVITVKEGWKIQLAVPHFKLEKPNDCESNFMDVFSDRTDIPSRQKNYCGSVADTVTSKNNTMFVRFYAEAKAVNSEFNALFTAFREKKKDACADDEYDCEDATCISLELKCNGRPNCLFRWDEEDCNTKKSALLNSEHIIIIMVIFSLILSGMCVTFFYNCIKKLIRDHHTIQEHIRQSREQQLNVLGHKGLEEAAIAAEAKKVMTDHSLSNSSHSSPSQKFDSNAKETTPCYVPGGELLPILIKGNEHRYNGELYGMIPARDGSTYPPEREEKYEQFEMCDSACQTRESLFDPPVQQINHQPTPLPMPHPSPPAPFSTFGYKKEDRYRAEGKIHIEKVPEKQRGPYSIQSTKSAPDVIVTH